MHNHGLVWLQRLIVLVVLVTFTGTVVAQGERELRLGLSIDGTISDDQRAQVYTYEASAGEIIKLTLISSDGMALGVLVTDEAGTPIAQGTDERANGFLVVDNVELDTSGTIYTTIFPLAVEGIANEGEFSISLALSSDSLVAQPTNEPDAASAEPTTEAAVDVTEAEPTETVLEVGSPGEVLTSAGVEVSLTWNATVDMNLEVRDPVGGTVFWDTPNTDSGGFFDGFNANGACETFTADSPTETIRWSPGAVPTGSYEILVFYVQDCAANGAVPFTVTVTVDGQTFEEIPGTTLPGQVFIASFDITDAGSVVVSTSGINQSVLPATTSEINAAARPITLNTPITGIVANEQPFQAYSFDASAGDIVTISMEATSGSLDTYLFLIDQIGNTIANNDDANAETRNSQITSQLIDTDGTYTVVATRYGQQLGGTEGNFNLSVDSVSVSSNLGEELRGVDLPDGIIEVSLLWETNADLQLLVRDPAGDAVFDDSPVIPSGGRLETAGNVGCVPAVGEPISYTYWPVGQRVRPGTYEIDVWFQSECDDFTPVTATLAVVIGGEVIISDTFTPLPQEHYITTFSIGVDGTVVRGLGGIAGGSETIDYIPELPTAPVLTNGVPVTGTISDDDRFDVYVFDGSVNDVVTLQMDAAAGTLDTLLFLLGPTGLELASNDDAVPNETTNSLISSFTLPQNGQYVVLATHYGTIYGGTNGTYQLTFTR